MNVVLQNCLWFNVPAEECKQSQHQWTQPAQLVAALGSALSSINNICWSGLVRCVHYDSVPVISQPVQQHSLALGEPCLGSSEFNTGDSTLVSWQLHQLHQLQQTNDHSIGRSTRNSMSSSKFHYLLVALVLRSSNFHHWC